MLNIDDLRRSLKLSGGMNRRLWLAYCSALTATPSIHRTSEARVVQHPIFKSNPFLLGVTSGDPTATGVVLWTRLAPSPLEAFGGMAPDMIEVSWVLAEDEALSKIVRRGKALATPQLGHSVHVEVEGLKPDRWYYYQFRSGDAVSNVGRTRTMPARDSLPGQFKFAFASCQHFEHGYYTAYADMASQNPDLVVHLGDYIYEYKGKDKLVRKHQGDEIQSLDDYRIRHSQYRIDPLLNRMHALCPWVVTWDDHEFDNNCAGDISEEKGVDAVDYLKRRANAYQAYYEMMPLRRQSLPKGPDMVLYRTIRCGRLAEFFVLDTRQYRTDQPNGDKKSPLNDEARRASNSLLGSRQGGWLKSEMLHSRGVWNVLAQQVMMGVVNVSQTEDVGYSMDQWPGYLAERNDLMEFVKTRRVSNPVVLTGDIHSNWVNNLRTDDEKPETEIVATEFVGTSISSGGDGKPTVPYLDKLKSRNPGVQYHGIQRGYVLCTLTPDKWQSDYKVVDKVTTTDGKVTTNASFVIESGKAGAKPV